MPEPRCPWANRCQFLFSEDGNQSVAARPLHEFRGRPAGRWCGAGHHSGGWRVESHDWLILAGIGLVSFVLSLIGAAVGMVLGHLRLPLLVAYLGSPVAGASTNLAISGLGALAGTAHHARGGRISLRALALVGIPSAIGAIVGMLLFVKVNRFWAHLVLGLLLLYLGIRMLRATRTPEGERAPSTDSGAWQMAVEVLIGLLLGAL